MDLVLLSVSGTLDAARVRESIAATFRRRATHPVPAAPPPPGAGVISYRAEDRTLEIRAKHEFVKNINPATGSPDGPQAQSCRPGRVRPLLRDLQMHRVMAEARKASAELAENSTMHCFRESFEPTEQALDLRMVVFLEFVEHGTGRLPSVSAELVVLNLATLKTFQLQVSSMKALLRQPAGLTFITGSNAGVRTFVTSALGHGSLMLGPGHRAVLGIHRHIPDRFVPVDRAVYAFTPFTLFNV